MIKINQTKISNIKSAIYMYMYFKTPIPDPWPSVLLRLKRSKFDGCLGVTFFYLTKFTHSKE